MRTRQEGEKGPCSIRTKGDSDTKAWLGRKEGEVNAMAARLAKRLGREGTINPRSKMTEFQLRNTKNGRVELSIHPENGTVRLLSRGEGDFVHVLELQNAETHVSDEGVEFRSQGTDFDATLTIDSAGEIAVVLTPNQG